MQHVNLKLGILALGVMTASIAYLFAAQSSQPPIEYASPATLLDQEPGFTAAAPDDSLPSLADDGNWGAGDETLEPILAADADGFALGVYSDAGYNDAKGRYVIDLLEQDYAYLSLIVTDPSGRPVVGAKPSFVMEGTSELLTDDEVGPASLTDASGTLDFALIGGTMALDRVIVSVGDARHEVLINVISLEASGFPKPREVDGGIRWQELMGARLSYAQESVTVSFPESIRRQADQVVKISGFMMPLEPDLKQKRFLLTSNPPSCFFHIPGGPAGAVEVFAPEGIEASWDPVIVEGRFELLETDEYGVIYRLKDAKLLKP